MKKAEKGQETNYPKEGMLEAENRVRESIVVDYKSKTQSNREDL